MGSIYRQLVDLLSTRRISSLPLNILAHEILYTHILRTFSYLLKQALTNEIVNVPGESSGAV